MDKQDLSDRRIMPWLTGTWEAPTLDFEPVRYAVSGIRGARATWMSGLLSFTNTALSQVLQARRRKQDRAAYRTFARAKG